MRKSKENETLKNDKNLDSNELARENVIKTIKGTEKVFDGIGNIFKSIWKFLTAPGMILGFFKFQ